MRLFFAQLPKRIFSPLLKEREVFVRQDGHVRYIKLRPIGQFSLLFALLALLAWGGFFTGLVFWQQETLNMRADALTQKEAEYQQILHNINQKKADLIAEQDRFDEKLDAHKAVYQQKLEEREIAYRRGLDAQLQSLVENAALQDDQLTEDLQEIAKKHGDSTPPQKLDHILQAFEKRLMAPENRLFNPPSDEGAPQMDLARINLGQTLKNTRAGVVEDTKAMISHLETERRTLASLGQAFTRLGELVDTPPPSASTSSSSTGLPDAESHLANIQSIEKIYEFQNNISTGFIDYLNQDYQRKRDILAMTEQNVDMLLNLVGRRPQAGGGLDNLPDVGGPALALLEQQGEIELALGQLQAMDRLFNCLPLIAPIDFFHITSRFGPRKDPITGRNAQHKGLDLGGWPGIPVLATAPGKVVKARRHAAYGRMVEIDHGCGISTRYGHLRKISVKAGQEVTFRDKLGTLGSTGRATGPHVHFEVIIQGRHVNPEHFIEAGRHVFKIRNQIDNTPDTAAG